MDEKIFKIVLICTDPYDQKIYERLLSRYHDAKLEIHPTISHFRSSCAGNKYSGFVVDMRSLISSSTAEKEFFASLPDAFPVVQIRWGASEQQLYCVSVGRLAENLSGQALLDHFISKDCAGFTPRYVRSYPRKPIYLNVIMHGGREDQAFRTNTLDISEGGCFVLATWDQDPGNSVFLKIQELRDKNPIRASVRWKKPWGSAPNHLPGMGVSFDDLSKEQENQILDIVHSEFVLH